jgi:basic membrane lipoprotein Med (substrate-binding protein (PBP1-ABC) superfamily)
LKQTTACQNNQKQNFINWRLGKRFTQCRPELKFSHSVCRHCCNESSSCFDATTRFSSWNRADWKSKTPAPITPTPTAPRPITPTQPPITRGLGPMCDQANCGDGWCLIDSTCYKLLPDKDEKNTLKRACKKEGAILATPMSQKLNSDLKIYLDMIRFPGQEVWLGLNDGITEGTYVKDNTKNPVVYIDWFNWDENAGDNTDEISSVKFNYNSETWFRFSAEDEAYAVCTKEAAGRSIEVAEVPEQSCDQGVCDAGWCQIEDTCYKLLADYDQKNNLKKQCKAEKAILATPMSSAENQNLKEYLRLIDFQYNEVWLGLNDGITEGTYVQDNTKNPVIYIDWFNWDENAGDNTDEISSVKFNYDSETWFRYTAESYAHAVCTKDAPGSPSRSLEEEKTCDQGVCEDGWCQIEDTCYKLLDEVDQKNTLKKQCKTEGAILATPMSETDNDNLWEYLDLINFQNQGQEVWLGLNDGITEGTYVQDNTKNPVVYIDWFNWDENAGNNTDELSSVKFNFDSKTWFRYSAEDFANAVCTKPAF